MSCIKVKFSDEKQAMFYVKKLQETSNRDKVPNRAYLCEICFTWHITSSDEIKQIDFIRSKYEAKINNLKETIRLRDLKIENQKQQIQNYYKIIKSRK